jgi:hypothetical protein
MAFQLSPGVQVTETDLTSVVPAVGTSIGGVAGKFTWGPIDEIVDVSTENQLVNRFGKPPAAADAGTFFAATSFLSYTGALKVIRASDSAARNASVSGTAVLIKNEDIYEETYSSGNSDAQGMWSARYAGNRGNHIIVGMSDGANASLALTGTWTSTTSSTAFTATGGAATTQLYVGATIYDASNVLIGTVASVTDNDNVVLTANATVAITAAAATRKWEYAGQFDYTPGTTAWATNAGVTGDEVHIVVVDATGFITGVAGTILEKFQGVSKASDAKNSFGESNHYREVINNSSEWIWWMDHPSSVAELNKASWAVPTGTVNLSFSTKSYTTTLLPSEIRGTLSGGVDPTPSVAEVASAYTLFANDELVDVNLIICGDLPVANAKSVIDNVATIRKDCVVFLSPDKASVVGQTTGQKDNILADITSASLTRSSYAVMDSGWKYMYDRYFDRYLWIPCNGDTAGLCARTDAEADPWFSPAGYNRGRLKNAVRLAYSPNKADRDELYRGGVNPIVGFPGSGIVLFGDKTLLEKPSAFDRINVRRLFIVLEKAIATASKFQLFEFNDEFTRAQFKNLVEPFLRDVQGRRGVYNFRVVCDASNNTQQVIDSNSFVADIFIQPARSINFIQLNFVASRTGIQFEEIGA